MVSRRLIPLPDKLRIPILQTTASNTVERGIKTPRKLRNTAYNNPMININEMPINKANSF